MFESVILGEQFVKTLIHEEKKRPYDPVKRREYYLKTRKLKGKKGSSRTTTDGRTITTTDPIGDTVRAVGNAVSWVKKKASEGVKDAKLTLEVMRLQSAANSLKKEVQESDNPRKKIVAAMAYARVLIEIEKKKREIAKSSV